MVRTCGKYTEVLFEDRTSIWVQFLGIFFCRYLLLLETDLQLHNNIYMITISFVRFKVLKAASKNMAVFWVVAPCSLVEIHRRFRGSWFLHRTHRPDDGGSRHIWNDGELLTDCTAQQPRRQPSWWSNLISYLIRKHRLMASSRLRVCRP
jgi:hypothetical protein